jgi:Uma2 family endonuclease
LIRPREDFYGKEHPKPGDVLLLVEISDTSLRFDQNIKLPVYAKSGIQEVWIADLTSDVIRIHRKPKGRAYASIEVFGRDQSVSPEAFPDFSIRVDDLLG